MRNRLLVLAGLLLLSAAGYMLIDAKAPWSFLLPFRATKLAALILVGMALSVATILFQTITANRILTPSLMGFDALYVFVLTALVYLMGASGYAALPPWLLFAMNISAMIGLSLLLFAALMRLAGGDMVRLVLTGIVIGLLIRALTGFLQRVIDPSEFQMVQAVSFARFTQVEAGLLALAAIVVLPAMALAWRMRHRLDVLALGPDTATGLGENPTRLQRQSLVLICLLVAAPTALVGPMAAGGFGPASFFGLIVSAFAHVITPTHRHAILLPSAALTGAIVLVGGQTVMERVLNLATPLTVVIELVGGVVFLTLLIRRRAA
ncbi:iron chelate uptake ABC transporter family permease subunit [Pseudooceanicola sp. LIPI14-2-Ac024]|uniref:iron chelate uptake ABC transporter family permease subunit n=1 Tax=Pseudooceanicola sp. LIPI14-2-Ac024 TaxID=3344875 RepID=UPI0035CF9A5A